MILFQHDIKHLCEFWNYSKKDNNFDDRWRHLVSSSQRTNWPINSKLRQQQLAVDHENFIRLLPEDGFDGKPVFEGKWSAIKKYLETSGWPSVITSLRFGDFFHLNIIQTLILSIKASFEKALLQLPDTAITNIAKIHYEEKAIETLTENFVTNAEELKFKLDIRDFRNTSDLFIFFKEYYLLDIEFQEFVVLIKDILGRNLHLISIFSKDTQDFINTTKYSDKRNQNSNSEQSVSIVLKLKWADRKIDLKDKMEDLNTLLEEYGIMIKEWSSSLETPYNYYLQSNEMIQRIIIDGESKSHNTEQGEHNKDELESLRDDFDGYYRTLETKIQKIYQESTCLKSEIKISLVSPGKTITEFAEREEDYYDRLGNIEDIDLPGRDRNEKNTFLEEEITELGKTIAILEGQMQRIKAQKDYRTISRYLKNPMFYKNHFLNETRQNINTLMEAISDKGNSTITEYDFQLCLQLQSHLGKLQ